MKQSSLVILAFAGLLAGLLIGCGETPAAPLAAPLAPAAQPADVTLVDALGRTVRFATPPQRIVLAGKSTLTMVDAIYLFPEARDRVTALTVGQQPIGDFIGLVDPSFGSKTVLAVEAGPEQIAPLQPDVVLLRSMMADKLGRSLETLNIPVVYLDLETPEQYFRDLKVLGQLLGNPGRAAEIEAFYRARLEAVDRGLQGLADGQKPRVLLVQYGDKGGEVALNVPPASWIQTLVVERAGGVPVWKEAAQGGGWTVIGLEQIATWNPDAIVIITYKGDAAATAAQLKADPKWAALKAVSAGRIYGFPADVFSWDQPDPRWILGTTWLAGKLHPDRFPGLEIKGEAGTFFEQMYGLDAATVQEKLIATLKGDVH